MGCSLGSPQQCRGGDSSSQGGDIPSTMEQGRVLSIPGAALPAADPHPHGIMDPYIPATAGLALFTGMEFIPK